MSEWIFLATENALNPEEPEIHFGSGPFFRSPTPLPSRPAFYFNDFSLSEQQPWLHPTEYQKLRWKDFCRKFSGHRPEQIQWIQPFTDDFSKHFSRIQEEIQSGRIRKAVPHVSQDGKFAESLAPSDRAWRILSGLDTRGLPQRSLFGWSLGDEAYLGLSPELLFEARGLDFRTMALAGTHPRGQEKALLANPKELHEHALVIEGIEKSLRPLSSLLTRGKTEVLSLGPLCHLMTRIEGRFQSSDWNEIIRGLHPTPALGTFPKGDFEVERSCPYLGAPLGFTDGQSAAKFIVTLRGLRIFDKSIQVTTGCGVTQNSVLENEWNELALKRKSVRESFGLGG